jgi:signal transduction histidine kinase
LATPAFAVGAHVIEICLATYITLLTAGSPGPFWLFFLFVLLGAGYRWGLGETLATACTLIIALTAQGVYQYQYHAVVAGDLDPSLLTMRGAYLLVMAVLVGYLTESEKINSASTLFVARLVEAGKIGAQLKSVLKPFSQELRRMCGAKHVSLVMAELDTGETFSWHDGRSGEDRTGLVIPIHLGADAAGYFFVGDSDVGESGVVMRFLQEFCKKVSPALHNAYLVERLRSQVSREEREHLGQELHDGAVQTLTAAMLQIEALNLNHSNAESQIRRIQNHLSDAMKDLRDLSQKMRLPEVDGEQLPVVLRAMVEKFQRDSGIAATFNCDSNDIQLAPKTCRAILRIVHEALVNIRKHSRARNVTVWLLGTEDWIVTIEDDGQGFEFSGRLPQLERNADSRGPAVIKERVRAAGGTLTIESVPGKGARLEVAFPYDYTAIEN